MNRHNRLTSISLLCAAMLFATSCNKEMEGVVEGNNGHIPIVFTAMEQTASQSRATATAFERGNAIGIYMLTAGSALPGGITLQADNRRYTMGTSGFEPYTSDQTLYYPLTGSVDFIAYHPYKEALTEYKYPVDLSDQSTVAKQAAADLLYSNAAKGIAASKTAVNLPFVHKLSKLIIRVKAGTGMENVDFAGITATLSGFPSQAKLSLADGITASDVSTRTIIPLKLATAPEAGVQAVFEAILLPQANVDNRKVDLTVGGKTFTWTLPAATAFASTQTHSYDLTLKLNPSGTAVAVCVGDITAWTGTTGNASLPGVTYGPAFKVGDFYPRKSPKICFGIVFKVNPDGQSGLIVGLQQKWGKWETVQEWVSQLTAGGRKWYCPKKEELEALKKEKKTINRTYDILFNKTLIGSSHWTSTPFDDNHMYALQNDVWVSAVFGDFSYSCLAVSAF